MKGFLVYPIKFIPLLSILLLVGCAVPSDVGEDINVGKSGDLEKGTSAYYIGDYATALEELKPLAEQGDANAQSYLGLMYHQGLGVIQDNIRAYMWLHLSASQGSRVAKINLKKVRWEMNSTDETKAYELAKRCLVKNYKDC